MKPTFGAETLENLATRMVDDPDWAMRYLWWKKTGTPPISYDEFRPGELAAFLVGIDKVLEQQAANPDGLSPSRIKRWGPPRRLKQPTKWDEAIKTGDPLIDQWEREIAEGRTPDLSTGGRK